MPLSLVSLSRSRRSSLADAKGLKAVCLSTHRKLPCFKLTRLQLSLGRAVVASLWSGDGLCCFLEIRSRPEFGAWFIFRLLCLPALAIEGRGLHRQLPWPSDESCCARSQTLRAACARLLSARATCAVRRRGQSRVARPLLRQAGHPCLLHVSKSAKMGKWKHYVCNLGGARHRRRVSHGRLDRYQSRSRSAAQLRTAQDSSTSSLAAETMNSRLRTP